MHYGINFYDGVVGFFERLRVLCSAALGSLKRGFAALRLMIFMWFYDDSAYRRLGLQGLGFDGVGAWGSGLCTTYYEVSYGEHTNMVFPAVSRFS